MITKEKLHQSPVQPLKKARINIFSMFGNTGQLLIFIVCGFLLSGASGGAGLPLCAAFTAAVSPFSGFCIFAGSLSAYAAASRLGDFLADIAAMPVIIIFKLIAERLSGRKLSSKAAALLAGGIYIIAGTLISLFLRTTAVLTAAVLLRGALCAAAAFFISQCAVQYRSCGKISITGNQSISTAVLYVIAISALSSVKAGEFCMGRAIGIFVILAAGGRFGTGGSAVAGALTAMGVILGEADGTDLSAIVRSTALTACSGLVSGYFSRRSRTASSVAFIISVFVLIVFMERIQWASALMTDTVIAAALYCLIPDRLYMRVFNSSINTSSHALEHFGSCMSFAAETLSGIRRNVSEAADALKKQTSAETDIPDEVCRKICSSCRNNMFCCKGSVHRTRYVFEPVLVKLYSNGFITERELPRDIEGCHRKTEITECFNECLRSMALDQRNSDMSARLWENSCGQLISSENILLSFANTCASGLNCDETLSSRISSKLKASGAKNISCAAFYDKSGHIFISAVFSGTLSDTVSSVTDALCIMTDHDLDQPVVYTENGLTSIRWHDVPCFAIEAGKAVCAGSEETSGDYSLSFSDGFGRIYYLISDGMGSGGRAALESSMTAAVLARLIRSGINAESAIYTSNLILLSKSSDEVFSTIDLLCINLFTGRADIFKMGAAPTLIKSGGFIKAVESRNLPAGIISPSDPEKRTLYLSCGDAAVMFSDGISEQALPKIRELMLSDGYSPQRCADEIIEYDKKHHIGRQDDRTVIVVKLHKS